MRCRQHCPALRPCLTQSHWLDWESWERQADLSDLASIPNILLVLRQGAQQAGA